MPTIDKPTRVHSNFYSLIDNIFFSNLEDYLTSGNIISDLTDHFSQFCVLHSDKIIFKHDCYKNLARDYSRYSETEFPHDFSIYENDNPSDPSNYRSISPLSVFNRIFEKIMYYRLKSFLEKKNILCDSQYGFREKRSTEHATLDIINQICLYFLQVLLSS